MMTTHTIGKLARTGELMNLQVGVQLQHQVRKADEAVDQGLDLLHHAEEEVTAGETRDLHQEVIVAVADITKVVALIIGEVVGLGIETTPPQPGTEMALGAGKGQGTTPETDVIVITGIVKSIIETAEGMIVGVERKTLEDIINHIEIKVIVRELRANLHKLR